MSYLGRGANYGFLEVQKLLTFDGTYNTVILNYSVGSASSILIVLDGVIKEPGTDYSISLDGNTVTFSSPPVNGTEGFILYLGKQISVPRTAGQNITTQRFVSDGSGDPFVLSSVPVVPDSIIVIVDGVIQKLGTNYTLLGSNITFTPSLSNGTEVEIISLAQEKVSIDVVRDYSITRNKLFPGSILAEDISIDNGYGTNTPLSFLNQAKIVNSIDDLLNINHSIYSKIIVLGYYTPNDGGGGIYYSDISDTTSGSHFSGTISGTTLTVTTLLNGSLSVGQRITGNGVTSCYINSLGTGVGGTGTYIVTVSQTVSLTTISSHNGGNVLVSNSGCRWKLFNESGKLSVYQFGALNSNSIDSSYQVQSSFLSGYNIFVNKGKYLSLSRQVVITTPMRFINKGTLKALGSTTLGNELFKIRSDDVVWKNLGFFDGNNTNWCGVSAFSTTYCMRNIHVELGKCENFNPTEVSVAQYLIAFASIIGGSIKNLRGKNLGGFGVYSQFCQGLIVDDIQVEDVNYSGVNSSANLDCKFTNCQVRRIGYFGLKGGYGLAGNISGDITPTSTTFSIPKTNANTIAWKVGQEFLAVLDTNTCVFAQVKSITNHSTYYTITTAKPMQYSVSVGNELQLVDNSHWIDSVVEWTGDNGFDQNIVGAGFKIINPVVRYAGQYTGFGDRTQLGAGIWLGADPQGSNQGFKINNIKIEGADVRNSAGSGIQIFGVGENVIIENPVCIDYCQKFTRGGVFVANDLTPSYGGIELNMLTFDFGRNISIINPVCRSDNGYALAIGYSLYAKIVGGNVQSAQGVIIRDAVGGIDISNLNCVSNLPGSSALNIAYGAQTTRDVRLIGGRYTANGAGSMAINISATNASDLFISNETKLTVDYNGIEISNSSPTALINNDYDNSVYNVGLVVPSGKTKHGTVKCSVAASGTQDICTIAADNGTNGLIEITGDAWNSAFAKETFFVRAQGDSGTIITNTPVFTSLGSVNGTQFMNLDTLHDFTAVAVTGGFKIVYTNHTANTVRLNMDVLGISRY